LECDRQQANRFKHMVLQRAPAHAVIQRMRLEAARDKETISGFTIRESESTASPNTILPRDTAICPDCRRDMLDPKNRRFQYPFTTCINCGPRASIIRTLPFDRPGTSMAHLPMCPDCEAEYRQPGGRRAHSQTNSCPACSIPLHFYDRNRKERSRHWVEMLELLINALKQAKTVAVKGIGGYHLLADARQEAAIQTLRKRKHRPRKPFAVLYQDLDMARRDVVLRQVEEDALTSPMAPVVLCPKRKVAGTGALTERIAPALNRMGVLLPYTPMLWEISRAFQGPMLATSANISGAPMIFRDEQALDVLPALADYILSFERDIVMPHDDSVIQFNHHEDRIILRRGRGFVLHQAPNLPAHAQDQVLATGAELKGSFVLSKKEQTVLSAYLGDQQNLDARESYDYTLEHLQDLYTVKPGCILADAHPQYGIHQSAAAWAAHQKLPIHLIQHHRAHFAAVLAEHEELFSASPALGFMWDGSGYGDDGQIWGGEVFLKHDGAFQRILHIDYFPVLAGDKMSREPRIAALALLHAMPEAHPFLRPHFSGTEWKNYHRLLAEEPTLQCSSMGRLLDAIAFLLGLCTHNAFEGEAAMKLEALAGQSRSVPVARYPFLVEGTAIRWQPFFRSLMEDVLKGVEPADIALFAFSSLATMMHDIAAAQAIHRIAFSGGVFQNALLTDLLRDVFAQQPHIRLLFHKAMSPNDENIAFGQFAFHHFSQRSVRPSIAATTTCA
jgi:hydrogenase maturation protein HypF